MFLCEHCGVEVQENDDFCPRCGTLFEDNSCDTHNEVEAEGVCLVCGKICCPNCGLFVNQTYLCNEHSDIEVFQTMGRVYGSNDAVEIDYLTSILEEENFHPFKFNRKNNSLSLGGSDFTLFRSAGEYTGHIINEIKILVPLNEYLEAKKVIDVILKTVQLDKGFY